MAEYRQADFARHLHPSCVGECGSFTRSAKAESGSGSYRSSGPAGWSGARASRISCTFTPSSNDGEALTPVRMARPHSRSSRIVGRISGCSNRPSSTSSRSGIGISASGSRRRAPSRRPSLPTISMPSEPGEDDLVGRVVDRGRGVVDRRDRAVDELEQDREVVVGVDRGEMGRFRQTAAARPSCRPRRRPT